MTDPSHAPAAMPFLPQQTVPSLELGKNQPFLPLVAFFFLAHFLTAADGKLIRHLSFLAVVTSFASKSATLPTVTFRYAVLVSKKLEATTEHAHAF